MRGVVTTRALFAHAPLIVREFGLVCYVRCWRHVLTGHRTCTFLECIQPIGGAPRSKGPSA